jgi:hypothetical protein
MMGAQAFHSLFADMVSADVVDLTRSHIFF